MVDRRMSGYKIPDSDLDPTPDEPTGPIIVPGDTDRENQWMEWYRDKAGVWRTRFHSGKPPKNATKRGDGWVLPASSAPSSSSSSSASSSSSSSSSAKKDSDPNNLTPPPRNGRPPYLQPERYFDAVANRWRWRWRYVPTNAELKARRSGLSHDSQGYYRTRNGRRSYVTGRTEKGRRYHWDWHDGQRRRVWDDPSQWPGAFKERRQKLNDRKVELKSRLESLRDQYRHARSDQHVLKRNIMRRIRQVEANLNRVEAALKRLPRPNPFLIDFSKQRPRLRSGIRVTMDLAPAPKDKEPLGFTTRMSVGPSKVIYVRATISLEDRNWRPGLLGAPEMVRVKWTIPKGWYDLGLPYGHWGSDEYFVSNPLQLVRPFRSPGTGDPRPSFRLRAEVYEFTWAENANAHREAEL